MHGWPGGGGTTKALVAISSAASEQQEEVIMADKKLTPLQQLEAQRAANAAAKANKGTRVFSDAEKATRKERVVKAKDALARSAGTKGDHVAAARKSLKRYLQQMNEPNQPDDARFEMLIEAPFKAPPKKRQDNRGF